jgi:hypothetical protein
MGHRHLVPWVLVCERVKGGVARELRLLRSELSEEPRLALFAREAKTTAHPSDEGAGARVLAVRWHIYIYIKSERLVALGEVAASVGRETGNRPLHHVPSVP